MLVNMTYTLATTEEALTIGLSLMAVGMLVVFISLAVIGLLITAMGKWFAVPEPARAPSMPAPAPVLAAEPASTAGIPPHHLVVISAAVAALLGRGAKLKQVRFVRHSASTWAEHGRVAIHGSHNVRKS